MSDETVKRGKSLAHREKISRALMGNLNALKHSRYSKRPRPAATCNWCPLAAHCPRYRAHGACVFVCEQVRRAEIKLASGP